MRSIILLLHHLSCGWSSCNEAPRLFRFALTFNGHHHQLMAIKQPKTKKKTVWRTTTAPPARDNLLKKKRTEKRRLLSLAQGKTRNGPRDEIKRRARWEENGWLCWWKKKVNTKVPRESPVLGAKTTLKKVSGESFSLNRKMKFYCSAILFSSQRRHLSWKCSDWHT